MLNVNSKYENDILQYCKINNIEDVSMFVTQCFKQGFDIKKYGFLGNDNEVVKEVEKIVEVKVIEYVDREVIKEIFRDVPIEKIVTKIEYISDKTGENELLLKIQQLESEMSKKDENLDELRRNLDEVLDKPPVEIVKEVEVVKEVTTDNSKQKMLEVTLQNLRKELTQKNQTIDELIQKNKLLESQLNPTNVIYLKGSNLNERI